MNEIAEYLDRIGHRLGIGGFEGVIGAVVLLLAATVIVVHLFSYLRAGSVNKHIERDIDNPLEWMADVEKTLRCDHRSKVMSPSWDILHIWHKRQ